MKLVISHMSALELLRNSSVHFSSHPEPCRSLKAGGRPTSEQTRYLQKAYSLTRPIHVLVSQEDKQPSSKQVVIHTRSGLLPHGSLWFVDKNVYVVSPELCYVQQSLSLDLPTQISLGYELCGTYRAEGIYRCDPLSNPAKLSSYLQRARGMYGLTQAGRALRYVLPDSASPMETNLSMLLCLPPSLGGYSLSNPQLNARINPSKRFVTRAWQNYFKCDLYWSDAKLAVEYDSNYYHTGAERIARDSKRRDELSALGITVITVTAAQIYNFQEFDKVAHTIARHLGKRLATRSRTFTSKQLTLRKALLLGAPNQEAHDAHRTRSADIQSHAL